MEQLKKAGIKTVILSSRTKSCLLTEMKNHGFDDLIDDIETEASDKREVIHKFIEKHEIEKESTIYVGDLPHDIETARHGGVRSVAVLAGQGRYLPVTMKAYRLI